MLTLLVTVQYSIPVRIELASHCPAIPHKLCYRQMLAFSLPSKYNVWAVPNPLRISSLVSARTDDQLELAVKDVFQTFGPVYVKIRRDSKGMPFAFCQYEVSSIALDLWYTMLTIPARIWCTACYHAWPWDDYWRAPMPYRDRESEPWAKIALLRQGSHRLICNRFQAPSTFPRSLAVRSLRVKLTKY